MMAHSGHFLGGDRAFKPNFTTCSLHRPHTEQARSFDGPERGHWLTCIYIQHFALCFSTTQPVWCRGSMLNLDNSPSGGLNCALDPLRTFSDVDVGFARLRSNTVVVLTAPICTVCNSALTDGDLIESSTLLMKNCLESWIYCNFRTGIVYLDNSISLQAEPLNFYLRWPPVRLLQSSLYRSECVLGKPVSDFTGFVWTADAVLPRSHNGKLRIGITIR